MEGNKTGVGESDMKRKKRGKQTLKRKMLSILLLCAMSCILAVVIVSYMTIRMIQNDSIQESMQIYLEQITREMDNDYYDMIGIVNQMSPNGLIGSVTERYVSAKDNYDRYFEQKSLREELIKLGYVNTKLLGIAYYDPKEQKELIGNFNVRVLDPSYQTISKVVARMISSIMGSSPTGISGFGSTRVKGSSRVPRPPALITTGIRKGFRGRCHSSCSPAKRSMMTPSPSMTGMTI